MDLKGVGGSQEDAREQARLRVAKVLRAVLTPERYKKYEELQRARPTSPRSGTIWIYDSGRLVPHHVKLGLSDGIKVEILEGVSKTDKIKLPENAGPGGMGGPGGKGSGKGPPPKK